MQEAEREGLAWQEAPPEGFEIGEDEARPFSDAEQPASLASTVGEAVLPQPVLQARADCAAPVSTMRRCRGLPACYAPIPRTARLFLILVQRRVQPAGLKLSAGLCAAGGSL